MGQKATYKINGGVTVPFRDSTKIELEVMFGTENTASLTLDSVIFPDSTTAKNNTILRTLQQQTPLEGTDVDIQISDSYTGDSFNFSFYTDWNKLIFNADNELSIGLEKKNSVISFDKRASAITFALLEDENVLNNPDYQNIPYVIQNRKTTLEKIQLLVTTWGVFKAAADEVFKILAIVSDIPGILSIVPALINLTVTIASLVALIQRLIDLFEEIMDNFFPIVLYHSGVLPKVFITKAAEFLGYDGVEFGNHIPPNATMGLSDIMDRWALCPSKNDEKGIPVNFINISGALKPRDRGYNLFDMIEVMKDMFTVRRGIVDNILQLRPESDPYWTQSPGSPAPNSLVEQGFTKNGTSHYNYEDLYSSKVIEYATDDTDYWTNQDLANENDPNSAKKIIAASIVEPTNVTDQKRVISQKGQIIDLPYTMCSRKDVLDDLLDIFIGTNTELDTFKQMVIDKFTEFSNDLNESLPGLGSFLINAGGRTGAMKVENHFFNVAKCVFLEDINIGFETAPRIPADFDSHIGANALMTNWHSYNSLVPGTRDPNDLGDTNAKEIFEEVRMTFNISNFALVVNNPYFNAIGGGVGKYTRLKWNKAGGYAVGDYWVPTPWLQNVEETIL